MDQELIAYLDERFRAVDQQFSVLRAETNQQIGELRAEIGELRAETSQQTGELRAEIGELRVESNQQIGELRAEMSRQLELMNGSVRETHILIENMRGEVRVLAEATLGIDEKLESFRKPFDDRSEEMLIILRRLPPYAKLDGRVGALEDWRSRLGRDPIEVIRERYGSKGAA